MHAFHTHHSFCSRIQYTFRFGKTTSQKDKLTLDKTTSSVYYIAKLHGLTSRKGVR
nr:MAG TPA: hypothetical protein [Caudoviricetes sp.]